MTKSAILEELGLGTVNSGACGKTWIETPGGPELTSLNPATAQSIAKVRMGVRERLRTCGRGSAGDVLALAYAARPEARRNRS